MYSWCPERLRGPLRVLDRTLLAKTLLVALAAYKMAVSWLFAGSCRFVPSCSAYAAEAVEKYGGLRGLSLTVSRIARCHPFHPGGFDPVP